MDDSRIAPNPAPTPSRPEQGIGLVLAGGGAKGGYQIGVWRTLREMGIDRLVTGVAGASVGAINAALFAAHQQRPPVGGKQACPGGARAF